MFDKPDPSAPVIFFAKPPSLEELCAVTIKVNTASQGSVLASKFQPQIIRCRELIFTEPDLLATPAYRIENAFHIIIKRSFYKTGKLQARFLKIGLEASKPVPVTPKLFQSCLNYTMLARIAPNWNKAGQWLIQGRDFLTHRGYVDAVKMELTVNEKDMYFNLEASTVRFPALQLADLDVVETTYKEFLQNSCAEIRGDSILDSWCNVLPSMKKGHIISISHSLPRDSPFNSYKEIKRHWKNTYGYRLPETDDAIVYYQIHFRPLGDRLFTYPELCLRARDIQKLPRVDPKPILTAFMQDLHCKMSRICGQPLTLQTKANYPIISLCCSSQADPYTNVNLTHKVAVGKKPLYRKRESIQTPILDSSAKSVNCTVATKSSTTSNHQDGSDDGHGQILSISTSLDLAQMKNRCLQNMRTSTDQQNSIIDLRVSSDQTNKDGEKIKFLGSSCQGDKSMSNVSAKDSNTDEKGKKNEERCISSSVQIGPRIVPSFAPKLVSGISREQNGQKSADKIVPCFTPRITKVLGSQVVSQHQRMTPANENSCNISQSTNDRLDFRGTPGTVKPSFPVKIPAMSRSNNCKPTLSSKVAEMKAAAKRLCNPIKNIPKHTLPSVPEKQRIYSSQIENSSKDITSSVGSEYSLDKELMQSNDVSELQHSEFAQKNATKNFNLASVQHPSLYVTSFHDGIDGRNDFTSGRVSVCTGTQSMMLNPSIASKRAYETQDCTTKVKKPRTKPQVQDVDVESLARNGQLHKANSVTLAAWLKDKGIPCKCKEKKSELLDKVKIILDLCTAEV